VWKGINRGDLGHDPDMRRFNFKERTSQRQKMGGPKRLANLLGRKGTLSRVGEG